ncbi:glutamine amidotransferase-like class 1 domain-containing protein 3A, mitochondrial [Frieseomelitta varia]|uniref:glutamine amidotransferase-like class 1 domain-containing protein 3A, mitochondrial n=1 Tax=Frieseomelitta varia TaxID=561572 RepID=UPI001CB689F6|nr:glutamine amidotransferase-like class 1 domain-containing protein 3A, mitochondrial [Frieseomelitta varia]
MIRTRIQILLQNESSVFRSVLSSSFHASRTADRKKKEETCQPVSVAVILCGCGYLDGTETTEAISSAIHISQKDMVPRFYAPDIDICDTVDHLTKQSDSKGPSRNGMVEAARLARSEIKPLCECKACTHKALVLPGGFGAAKTLSNFAEKGADCTVLPDLEKLIEDFYCEKKPIASICIASVLVARVLKGVKITLGKDAPAKDWPYADAIKKARNMGAKIEMRNVKGVTKCKKYNVLSTPAWMYNSASFAEVHNGIGKLIAMLKKSIN